VLAPVLAQLGTLPGVREAHVDPTGQYFLLEPISGRKAAIVECALSILGPDARLLDSPWQEEEIGSLGKAELWLSKDTIRNLSMLEGRLLADRWGRAAARSAGLDANATFRLIWMLRRELNCEFNRVHAQGGAADKKWYLAAFPSAFDRLAIRFEPYAKSNQVELVRKALHAILQGEGTA
jgi:hypothetical protein